MGVLLSIILGILLSLGITAIGWAIFYYFYILPIVYNNSADLYQWRADQLNSLQ